MADQYAQVQCGGVRLVVTDRDTLRPVTVALALARELRVRHRDQFRPESIQNLLVNRSTMWAFLSGESFDRLVAWADTDRSSFLNRRASCLMSREVAAAADRTRGRRATAPAHPRPGGSRRGCT